MLGGQGADEALLGYRKYLWFQSQELWQKRNVFNLCCWYTALFPTFIAQLPYWRQYWLARHRYNHTQATSHTLKLPASHLQLGMPTTLKQRQLADIHDYSLPTLLRYEDRNSMAHSVESRLPFMDSKLMAFAVALPNHCLLKNGYGKWLLRRLVSDKLPRNVAWARYKRGFDVHLPRWVAMGLGSALRKKLQDYQNGWQSYCDKRLVVDDYFSDRAIMYNQRIFSEAMTLLWLSMIKNTALGAKVLMEKV
jgi:asparagine synthase (glutamine-hydrolysing)